jgi:hypothetical protein
MKKFVTHGREAIEMPTHGRPLVHTVTLGHVPHVHTRDNKLVGNTTFLCRP